MTRNSIWIRDKNPPSALSWDSPTLALLAQELCDASDCIGMPQFKWHVPLPVYG